MALQLEDFDRNNPKTVKSSVGMQLTIVVMENRLHARCEEKPTITMVTKHNATCLRANVGREIKLEMVAESYNEDDPMYRVFLVLMKFVSFAVE